MKKLFAIFLVLALLLTGCSEVIDDPALRTDAEALLNAFVTDDYDACRALIREEVSDADLEAIFDSICQALEGMGSYEMTAVNWNRNVSDGHDLTTIRYLVVAENIRFYLSVAREEGLPGLTGFQVQEAPPDAEPTEPMGVAHWIFLIVGLAVLGFVIWMAVDCARRKMKRKWLWLPLILLGMVLLTLTMRGGDMSFRFNIGLYLGVTSLKTFTAGGFQATIYVPLAAIIYFFKRKDLTIRPEAPAVPEAPAEEPTLTETEEEA